MAKEPPKYPQLTEAQVEIWLANPVTQTLLQCFEWKRADSVDNAGAGRVMDSGNADLTHAMLHVELGKQSAFDEAKNPEALFDHYAMILHPEKEDEDGAGRSD